VGSRELRPTAQRLGERVRGLLRGDLAAWLLGKNFKKKAMVLNAEVAGGF